MFPVFIKWQQGDEFYFLFDNHLRWTEKGRARSFPDAKQTE